MPHSRSKHFIIILNVASQTLTSLGNFCSRASPKRQNRTLHLDASTRSRHKVMRFRRDCRHQMRSTICLEIDQKPTTGVQTVISDDAICGAARPRLEGSQPTDPNLMATQASPV